MKSAGGFEYKWWGIDKIWCLEKSVFLPASKFEKDDVWKSDGETVMYVTKSYWMWEEYRCKLDVEYNMKRVHTEDMGKLMD